MKKRPSGHPATQDPDVAQLFRTMRAAVYAVRDLESRLTEENYMKLKASALGLMFVYAELAGLPEPDEVVGEVFESVVSSIG